MLRLVKPRTTRRVTSESVIFRASPICFKPRLSKTTPMASKTRAMRRMMMSLVILEILVTEQLDFELFHELSDTRAGQGVQFILKLVE